MLLALPEPWRITRWFALSVGVLLLASTIGQIARLAFGYTYLKGLIPLFYVDEEANVPTWYSSAALLAAAALLLAIGLAARSGGDRRWPYWASLSALFLALSIDEVAQIHELPIEPLRRRLDATGYLYYPWVIPGSIFALLIALAFARFVLGLPRPTRAFFVAAGLLFLSGSIGVEMISAKVDSASGPAHPAYVAAVTLEEGLEMAAIVVFLHALLGVLGQMVGTVQVASRGTADPSLDQSAPRRGGAPASRVHVS